MAATAILMKSHIEYLYNALRGHIKNLEANFLKGNKHLNFSKIVIMFSE